MYKTVIFTALFGLLVAALSIGPAIAQPTWPQYQAPPQYSPPAFQPMTPAPPPPTVGQVTRGMLQGQPDVVRQQPQQTNCRTLGNQTYCTTY